ncbi:MAG: DUF2336 domain-containing protein [Parvibaculum sp.]|nr:DUF2336 domain-containing protein [Parvibaculum sp.]
MALQGTARDKDEIAPPVAADPDATLRRLADLALLPATLVSPQERSILDSLLASLVTRFDPVMRQRLAERLAPHTDAPRELALALALDDIDIARPLLSEGQILKAGDLIHVVREGGPAHRLALAARKDLSSDIADALIEESDTALVCRLLENGTAALSLRAIETLARRSAAEPELLAPLLTRPELTLRLAHQIFWWAPSPLRLEILSRYTAERRHIHNVLDEIPASDFAFDPLLSAALSVVRRPVAIDKARLHQLLANAAADGIGALAGGLAELARLRAGTMFSILNDATGEPLSVFAKAAGLNRKEFGDLIVAAVDLRQSGLPGKGDLERMGELFDTISTDRADLALHCWDIGLANETRAPDSDD